jgi:hypothetical protein
MGLIALAGVLVITAILTTVSLGVFSGGSGPDGGGSLLQGGPAGDVSAKATLSQLVQAGAAVGDPGALSPGALQSASPGVTVTAGPSDGPRTASLASGGSSATLAVASGTGNCWYAWLGPSGTWYGAETGQHGCQAVALTAVAPGPVSSSAIGWQEGSFPSAP